MNKFLIFILLFLNYCDKKDNSNRDSSIALSYLFGLNSTSSNLNTIPDSGSNTNGFTANIAGDFTNNTPAGARCITNGTQGICATCNIAPSPSVNNSRTGSVVSTDDVDWYCYNLTAAGTVIISTERSDGFFQPKPTDTFISVHQSTVTTDYACTSPFSCGSGGAQQALDDDSNRTAIDPVRTYSLLERTETATVTRYVRVGLATNNPGAYRLRVVTKP